MFGGSGELVLAASMELILRYDLLMALSMFLAFF